jgi:hypothetical protein
MDPMVQMLGNLPDPNNQPGNPGDGSSFMQPQPNMFANMQPQAPQMPAAPVMPQYPVAPCNRSGSK